MDARRAVEAAASAIAVARAVGEATGGALRLACAQSLVSTLAPVIGAWHRLRPDVALSLRESTAAGEVTGALDAGDIDLALVPAPVPDRFVVADVGEEEIVLVVPDGHHLAARAAVSLSELDGVALVHYATENALSGWLDQALARVGARPRVVMRTAVTAAAPQLAAAGLGVAVCPFSAVALGSTVTTRSFAPRWTRQLLAVTPGRPDPLAALFIEDLRRHTATAPAGTGSARPPA